MSQKFKKRHHSSGHKSALAPQCKTQRTLVDYFANIEEGDMADEIELCQKKASVKEGPSAKEKSSTVEVNKNEEEAPDVLSKFLEDLDVRLDKKLKEQEGRIIKEIERSINSSIEQVHASMEELKEENRKLKEELTEVEKKCDKQEGQINKLKREVEAVREHAIKNEQYSRKNNLKIFGLQEKEGGQCVEEVQTMVKEKLKLSLRKEDIEVAHRLPATKRSATRPVIVKLRDTGIKFSLLKARRLLKGTGVSVTEDISQSILDTTKQLRDSPTTKDAWCWNGKIYIKDDKDRIHKYSYGAALPEYFLRKTDQKS